MFARGSQRGIRYVAESTWGVTPGSPVLKSLRTLSDTLALTKQTNQSAELRSDRHITDFRHGNFQVGGDIAFEFSFLAFDDLLESALFNAYAIPYNVTAQNISVDSGAKTFTRAAGSFLTDGVLVGDPITFSGFTNGGNNGTFIVSAVTANVVTCATATGLVTEAGGGDEAFTTTRRRLKTGTTLKSFTIEKAHLDVAQYLVFTGMAASSLRLSIQPNAMITGTFGMMGKALTPGVSPLDPTPDPAPTHSPFDSYTGAILEGGLDIAVATSLELNLDNGLEPTFVLMDKTAQALIDKRSNLTGTLSAYFQDTTMLNKFINEIESSLKLTLTDLDGNSYRIEIPRLKYGGGDLPVNSEGPIVSSMPFQALYDAASGTNLIIDKIPA